MAPKVLEFQIVEYDHARAVRDIDYACSIVKKPSFLSYDARFRDVLGPSPKITLVEQRDYQFAHEVSHTPKI